jgi:hypothetical protein
MFAMYIGEAYGTITLKDGCIYKHDALEYRKIDLKLVGGDAIDYYSMHQKIGR